MMSMEDGVFFRSVRLTPDHPLVGRRLQDAMNTWFADGRVLGLLPLRDREDYRNKTGDFGTHFVLCPLRAEKDLVLEAGDLVMVLGYPEIGTS